MGRGPKPVKSKKAKPAVARKRTKDEGTKVGDLEKRLAEALQRETAALKRASEAQDQQTATSEILRVIASSPTDTQPVFDVIARNAVALCDGFFSVVGVSDGRLVHLRASNNLPEEWANQARAIYPVPLSSKVGTATVIREQRVRHVLDAQKDSPDDGSRRRARTAGYRTWLGVPLLGSGGAIGVLAVARREKAAFTDAQIALLQTFAAQAVIAIENVRLFNDTKEALDQQTATADVLRVISSSPTDVQPVFDAIAESAARLCSANDAQVLRVERDTLRLVAACGTTSMPPVRQLTRGHLVGRAVIDRKTIHVRDLAQALAEYPETTAAQYGVQSALAVPLLQDGVALGVIRISRTEIRPFTDKQVALLQTFADQAVIAIENVRLFKELQEKNEALTQAHAQVSESLDQQTATSEILRVISGSPTDVQPVFDEIVRSAVQLCEATFGALHRFDAHVVTFEAHHGMTEQEIAGSRARFPLATDRGTAVSRAILDRRTIHIQDIGRDPEYRVSAWQTSFRTVLAVPLLRDDAPVGAIGLWRREVQPFSEKQIKLVETFADQAVIAIENVRLFNETKEALERQTATSEILRVISSSPTDVQPVFDAIAEAAARLCEAFDAGIYHLEGERLRLVAHHGPIPTPGPVGQFTIPLGRGIAVGRSVLDGRSIHVADIETEAEEFAVGNEQLRRMGVRTLLSVPLMREGVAIGAIGLRRTEVRPFTDQQISLLQTFADQAVIAIENVRLFKELQEKNQALTQAHAQVSEALDQQTATSEILRVISRSQADARPVFESIAENALRLFRAWAIQVYRFQGQELYLEAARGGRPGLTLPEWAVEQEVSRASYRGRSILDRAIIHVRDVLSDPEATDRAREWARADGWRSVINAPMLRDGVPIGLITVYRLEPGGFLTTEVELLKTFADQAVIAIENARLLSELQARTQELTRSVGELRALGEVGRAVSSTLDLETVLTTIVSRAVQLADLEAGAIYEYDEAAEVFHLRATQNLPEDFLQVARPLALPKGEGATGRLAVTREPVQIPDITAPDAYHGRMRDVLLRMGHRALLAVPLISEDHIVGGLVVNRRRPGEFAPEVIELLRTFATQSALAIQNARLFREVEDKSRQLEVASQHKSEFLANMSHELRTPLNAIIGFSEVLSEKMFGDLNEKQEEYSKDIHASGQHLLSLINDILDLSKIEAGRMELELSDFDLPTALDNALMLVRERAQRRSLTLHKDVDAGVGQIQGDERKIRQVVLNLLSNAIKFTPEGGRIEVVAVPRDGSVEVSVSDTGVGIVPEDQEKVFEEFRQVGTADKKAEGTGLGLTLCRKFVELHGGRIWVKSELGGGSTFTFTIPVRHGQ